jgi:DNA-binding Xre family transcriptional regulator
VSGLATASGRQAAAELAGEVAQLYVLRHTRAEIGRTLRLSNAQVQAILRELFAEGMPKRQRSMTDEQVRAIHAAYARGDRSIKHGAEAIGFSRAGAERRMRELGLRVERSRTPRKPARSPIHAEQRVITGLLVARVDELRRSRELSVDNLARESDLSATTLEHVRYRLRDPRLTTVLRLCRGLGVTPGELLDDLPLPAEPRPHQSRGREADRAKHGSA